MYTNNNVHPVVLQHNEPVQLSEGLIVTPLGIEHRADFTDTFCFGIKGRRAELLFCPDIDSWNQCAHFAVDTSASPSGAGLGSAPGADATALNGGGMPPNAATHNWLRQVLLSQRFAVLLLDATFYDDRDMRAIPHPRVVDTVGIVNSFNAESSGDDSGAAADVQQQYCQPCAGPSQQAVVLIHLNHSNRLWVEPALVRSIEAGSGVLTGRQGMSWRL